MYEVFEHTADLGLSIRGASLEELFSEAAKGLFSVLVSNLDDVAQNVERVFQISGSEPDYLLFDWLSELLYVFETEHLLFSHFEVTLGDTGITAICRGEPASADRHRLEHEVKAITYHELKVEHTAEGWRAEVILDI